MVGHRRGRFCEATSPKNEERWLSGRKRHRAKVLGGQLPRGFESLPLRQFSELGFWAIVASPRQRRGSASARILKGFLKLQNNFCPLKRKFAVRSTDKMKFYKPIFFLFPSAKGKAII